MARKQRTLHETEVAQERAVRAAETLLDDDDLAGELASLSPQEYAARKGFEIVANTRAAKSMLRLRRTQAPNTFQRGGEGTMPSKAQLEERISELEAENSELQDRLDEIFDLVAPDEDEDEGEDEEPSDTD